MLESDRRWMLYVYATILDLNDISERLGKNIKYEVFHDVRTNHVIAKKYAEGSEKEMFHTCLTGGGLPRYKIEKLLFEEMHAYDFVRN